MITAAQCVEASDLLDEREDIASRLGDMRGAKRVRLEYEAAFARTGLGPDGTLTVDAVEWRMGPTLDVTKDVRRLLMASLETALAEIDRKLETLGVAPPSETTVTNETR